MCVAVRNAFVMTHQPDSPIASGASPNSNHHRVVELNASMSPPTATATTRAMR